MIRLFLFVHTTADVRHVLNRASVSPETCDNKNGILQLIGLVATKLLKLCWCYKRVRVFGQLEKHDPFKKIIKNKRLHVFIQHMQQKLKRAKSSKNASRVPSEDFV